MIEYTKVEEFEVILELLRKTREHFIASKGKISNLCMGISFRWVINEASNKELKIKLKEVLGYNSVNNIIPIPEFNPNFLNSPNVNLYLSLYGINAINGQPGGYWWPLNEKGYQSRLEAFSTLIEVYERKVQEVSLKGK